VLPRWRMVSILVALALGLGAIVWRLADVQGLSNRRYAAMGRSQRMASLVLPAQRGSILDRNGSELAMSLQAKTVWADPRLITDVPVASEALASVLGIDREVLARRLSVDAKFSYLARKVDDSVAARVAQLELPGVFLMEEPRRFFPAATLAAPVLGTVGVDEQGLSGLELQYQQDLTGTVGQLLEERDPAGREIPAGMREFRPPTEGRQLLLTIDRAMQYETERVLAAQIVASRAKGGIAVVMDPTKGDILAMANLIADPRGPRPSADNMAVTRVYEPGSVNKVVTIAGAIEEGVVDLTSRMNVPDTLKVADAVFRDAEEHSPGWWTVGEVLAESSNVGTIMVGQRLGKQRIDRYLRAFGLASRTALGFPGESGGLLPHPDRWTGTSIATVPIGQGVAVTALQMLGAYNAIANGGTHVEPRLVRSVVGRAGDARTVPQPPPRRVVSESTAAAVNGMLVEAVREGTGTAAAIDGYTVAGKTGTARKPRSGGLGYMEGAYLASFVGFVPAEAPRLSAIVVLDEPTPYFGGLVSAPVFASLARYGVRRFQIPPGSVPATVRSVVAPAATVPSTPSPRVRETRAT